MDREKQVLAQLSKLPEAVQSLGVLLPHRIRQTGLAPRGRGEDKVPCGTREFSGFHNELGSRCALCGCFCRGYRRPLGKERPNFVDFLFRRIGVAHGCLG